MKFKIKDYYFEMMSCVPSFEIVQVYIHRGLVAKLPFEGYPLALSRKIELQHGQVAVKPSTIKAQWSSMPLYVHVMSNAWYTATSLR